MNKYIRSQSMAAGPLRVEDLICRDCKHRNDGMPIAFCDVYRKQRKPNSVLLKKGCPSYEEVTDGD